jgi:hypothetical protein
MSKAAGPFSDFQSQRHCGFEGVLSKFDELAASEIAWLHVYENS